ncbi:MAG: L,D-transpeptidase family protein [Arenicellales bacterium]|nr:L,D-transpeptidase family protein [Arenicellales bacterium]
MKRLVLSALFLSVLFLFGLLPAFAGAATDEDVSTLLRHQLQSTSVPTDFIKSLHLTEPELIQRFYRARDYAPVWFQTGELRSQANELLEAIRNAHREGLMQDDYQVGQIAASVTHVPRAPVSLARADIVLTNALLSYISDLQQGRLRHSTVRQGVLSDDPLLDIDLFIESAFAEGLVGAISVLAPESLAYTRLRDALADYRMLRHKEFPFSKPERMLKIGAVDGDVKALKERLLFLGDLSEANRNGNRFDDSLRQAVVRFQIRHGLEPDGIVGPKTISALAVPLATRVSQIELNLERWRWLPKELGQSYVVVNIADFALHVIQNDDLVLEMRAIVGKPFQQTPVFSSKIVFIVLNPYWEVPHSIATKEILPKLRQDPEYLEREHMRVLQSLNGKIRIVDPNDIDWNTVYKDQFPYRLRQDPGPANALGRIKFYLPNRYHVYLHDTPNKSLFSQTVRCFSHGCIRLEKPFDLAAYLLKDQPDWTQQRIIETLDQEKNHKIALTTPVPIYVVYWTAWVDTHGTIHFRDDVYSRDKRLSLELQQLN